MYDGIKRGIPHFLLIAILFGTPRRTRRNANMVETSTKLCTTLYAALGLLGTLFKPPFIEPHKKVVHAAVPIPPSLQPFMIPSRLQYANTTFLLLQLAMVLLQLAFTTCPCCRFRLFLLQLAYTTFLLQMTMFLLQLASTTFFLLQRTMFLLRRPPRL